MSRRWIWMGSLLVILALSCSLMSIIIEFMPREDNGQAIWGTGLVALLMWGFGMLVIVMTIYVLTIILLRTTMPSGQEKKKKRPPLFDQSL